MPSASWGFLGAMNTPSIKERLDTLVRYIDVNGVAHRCFPMLVVAIKNHLEYKQKLLGYKSMDLYKEEIEEEIQHLEKMMKILDPLYGESDYPKGH